MGGTGGIPWSLAIYALNDGLEGDIHGSIRKDLATRSYKGDWRRQMMNMQRLSPRSVFGRICGWWTVRLLEVGHDLVAEQVERVHDLFVRDLAAAVQLGQNAAQAELLA
jgi:hypothetical protein